MNTTTTILAELDEFRGKNHLNTNQLAKRSGLNPGTVSAILNNKRVLGVDQLDRITVAMNLPEGYFYEQYIEEYLNEVAPNWRRIRPFLYRCAELDKLHCIKSAVELLMDNLIYSPLLLEVAEDLFQQEKPMAAEILFESIAIGERNQHSERLAFCHYRLFLIRQGSNHEQNYQSALQFEPFVDRLDEIEVLDALKDLANTYRSLHRWDKVYTTATKLHHLAKVQYSLVHSREVKATNKKPTRPLFFYVAYSNLLIGGFHQDEGNYELAAEKANEYADLDWVKETDEESLHWKALFMEWAKANIFLAKLMSGHTHLLTDYVEFIGPKKIEITRGLWNIMIVANRYGVDVDHILVRFDTAISNFLEQKGNEVYNDQNTSDQQVGLLCELAQYYLNRDKFDMGFRYLLEGLEKSTILNDEGSMLRLIRLMERFRRFASDETEIEYHNLIEMGEKHEANNVLVVCK
ncbi:helix-turn-helix domain-containing protein [Paenibacillus enshidis]|uniref:Helix-turn-helix domain-containing protein n=1 Tax=Paenibacillus enshidis TaxID=1458439 RepID=A0ABV5AYN2_9BACL